MRLSKYILSSLALITTTALALPALPRDAAAQPQDQTGAPPQGQSTKPVLRLQHSTHGEGANAVLKISFAASIVADISLLSKHMESRRGAAVSAGLAHHLREWLYQQRRWEKDMADWEPVVAGFSDGKHGYAGAHITTRSDQINWTKFEEFVEDVAEYLRDSGKELNVAEVGDAFQSSPLLVEKREAAPEPVPVIPLQGGRFCEKAADVRKMFSQVPVETDADLRAVNCKQPI